MMDKGKMVCHFYKEPLGTKLICSILDPSTAFKPRSGERGKKSRPSISLGAVSPSTLLRTVSLSNGSGLTLSIPRVGARSSRRVD